MTALGPCHAATVNFDVAVGVPRIAFIDNGIPELTRSVSVAAETMHVRTLLTSTVCSGALDAPAAVYTSSCSNTPAGSAAAARDAQSATFTYKVPRWHPSGPSLELSVLSWRNGIGDGVERGSAHGSDVQAELGQSFAGMDVAVGISQPLRTGNAPAWAAAWASVAFPISPRARLRITVDTSREVSSGARDTRATLLVSHALIEGLRGNVYVTRSIDDPVRPWTAGTGLSWSF